MTTISKKIKIDSKLFKFISKIAEDENTTEDEFINDAIKKEIERKNKELTFNRLEKITNGKIKIANKDSFNPTPTEKELDSIVGLSEAPKGFDCVKAVEDSSVRKWK